MKKCEGKEREKMDIVVKSVEPMINSIINLGVIKLVKIRMRK